jgi:ParB family chromosome partitioning protein
MPQLTEMRSLPIDVLRISAQQVRTRNVDKDLDELAASIRVQGQLEPIIVVRSAADRGTYEIIAGQRRWLAMRRLGAASIHAVILEDVDEHTARAISVTENLVRSDLGDRDLIDVCTRLHRRYGSVRAVADTLGLPYGRVRNYVRFERLRQALQDLVQAGRVDLRTALRLEDHFGDKDVGQEQLDIVVDAVRGMTNAQKADYLAGRWRVQTTTPGPPPDEARGSPPGAVQQILVTMRRDEAEQLRHWARAEGLTQDAAAASVLRAFLRHRSTRSG